MARGTASSRSTISRILAFVDTSLAKSEVACRARSTKRSTPSCTVSGGTWRTKLAADVQWLSAGSQHPRLRGLGQDLLRELRATPKNLFAIVEHKQDFPACQLSGSRFGKRDLFLFEKPEYPSYRARHARIPEHAGQIDKPHAMLERFNERPSNLPGYSGFSGSSWSRERDQSLLSDQPAYVRQL